jgi:uncharacterized membrane protein YkvA (DUF1232 family)
MPLNINLELSDEDLAYFARLLDAVWQHNSGRPERELIDRARVALEQSRQAKLPLYVVTRLQEIGVLLDLLDDSEEWPLEAADRRRIVAAITYFGMRKDMIADTVPALGYLDDALVADLVARELRQDLEAYREFCEYRKNEEAVRSHDVSREDWLAAKRGQLFDRLRQHRERVQERLHDHRLTDPILQYKY